MLDLRGRKHRPLGPWDSHSATWDVKLQQALGMKCEMALLALFLWTEELRIVLHNLLFSCWANDHILSPLLKLMLKVCTRTPGTEPTALVFPSNCLYQRGSCCFQDKVGRCGEWHSITHPSILSEDYLQAFYCPSRSMTNGYWIRVHYLLTAGLRA